ncbi:Rrf2 family transcriptional regulator [Ramlibacter sp. GTP1]|uniref:Rrf2 family transcriptional regulator n=2 Tax=Ramlibacter albus TaxID=2079448 RepID=A0A923M8H6_9BURK|nr:Rrf2 family transcriptional regulator [Ramlibacter albus]
MKLTVFTDYSLRVLIYLATQPERRATIAEVAAAFSVPENHLVKVVHFLGKAGMLANVRGKGGGMQLATAPENIRVGNVIRATEGDPVLAECFAGGGCDCAIVPTCRLRGVLGEALVAFFGVLDSYTVADLVTNREQLAKILFAPPPAANPRPAEGTSPAAG